MLEVLDRHGKHIRARKTKKYLLLLETQAVLIPGLPPRFIWADTESTSFSFATAREFMFLFN